MTGSQDNVSSPIRIAIDARPFAGPPCGYTIYLSSVISCLREGYFELTLLSNQPLLEHHNDDTAGLATRVFGRPGALRWEQSSLPRHLRATDYDLYLTAANRGIPLVKQRRTRYVLVVHDVIPYLFFRDYYMNRWKKLLRHPSENAELVAQLIAAARADSILTVSHQSALDIRSIFHRRDVTAIPIPLKKVAQFNALQPKAQFVYIGGSDFRKRVDMLLRGFALFVQQHPGHLLLLVGSNYASLERLIAELKLDAHVKLTGYVDHETKFRILGESIAMVYPSLYEGYGLAIAEGFQARIPVIAGSGGSQREVGGLGARLIDPLSPDDIATAMAEMLDADVRADWIARGDEQLVRLSDPAIGKATAAYFEEQGRLARRRTS